MTEISKEARLRITASRIETALIKLNESGEDVDFLNSMFKLGNIFVETFPTYNEFAGFWILNRFPERFLSELKCMWVDTILNK
jgi:hypothetical protein